jgi:P27 family predicted phage terminase small subunit
MTKGRKKIPTKIKEIQGTLEKSRQINEMAVSAVIKLPEAPDHLTKMGKEQWQIVCKELYNKKMLFEVDLSLLAAYCNEMALYYETEKILKENGRVHYFYNDDGTVKYSQSVPEQKISKDALNTALKLAREFGFTPSARASIPKPEINDTYTDDFKFFE